MYTKNTIELSVEQLSDFKTLCENKLKAGYAYYGISPYFVVIGVKDKILLHSQIITEVIAITGCEVVYISGNEIVFVLDIPGASVYIENKSKCNATTIPGNVDFYPKHDIATSEN